MGSSQCSDWTKNMVEKTFVRECQEEYDALKKEYLCYTCKYYSIKNTMLGPIEKCNPPLDSSGCRISRLRGREAIPVKECNIYKKNMTN